MVISGPQAQEAIDEVILMKYIKQVDNERMEQVVQKRKYIKIRL